MAVKHPTPAARKRSKKPKLPASITPHEAVVLAVDTAERSGWAVYICDKPVSWGEVDMLRPERSADAHGVSGWDAERVCMHALWECGHAESLPVVLVYERPFRGTTQGQWIGAWKRAFLAEGGSKRRIHGVYPATWRARVLGGSYAVAKRETVREREMVVARAMVGPTLLVGSEAAPALGIGKWATHAGEVGAKLPKGRKRKAAA